MHDVSTLGLNHPSGHRHSSSVDTASHTGLQCNVHYKIAMGRRLCNQFKKIHMQSGILINFYDVLQTLNDI